MLSAFYWGYILTQVIGGNLSDRYGGDLIQWTAAIVWSLSTLSVIATTHVSVWLLVVVRFLTGLAQGGYGEEDTYLPLSPPYTVQFAPPIPHTGMHFPALSSLVAHKVQEHSRTKFYGVSHIGSYLG